MYPMDNYFNTNAPGINPFVSIPPSTQGIMSITNQMVAYIAPYDGEVVRLSVNSAFSTIYFGGATFDFLILDSTSSPSGTLNAGLTVWSTAYATGQQRSGWSTVFNGTTTFSAGNLIYCYIVDPSNNFWGNGSPVPAPLPGHPGLFNVTLYLRFTIP